MDELGRKTRIDVAGSTKPNPLSTQHSALSTRTRTLGIDPGLNRTGYAILERGSHGPILCEGGVIRSTVKLSLAERVREIGDGLREVLEQFRPQVMAIEQVFSTGKYPKSALLMAHARGAILFAAASLSVDVVHYTPRQIKRLLTGSGKAAKDQVQRAVSHELGLDRLLEPDDVADACAVALCHYYSVKLPVRGEGRGARGETHISQTQTIDEGDA